MNETIGKLINRLRIESGYESLGELSRASGVTVSTLSRIESDQHKPQPGTLKKLAPCLNVSQEELMVSAGYLDDVNKHLKAQEGLDTFFLRAIGRLSPEGKKKIYDYIEMVDALERQEREKLKNKKKH